MAHFNTMSYESVISAVKSIHGGSMARITYFSEMPLKAVHKKNGYVIYKVVSTTARFGVNYSNIGSVVALRNAPDYVVPAKKENNNEWVVVNRVSHNSKTGKTSVRFVPMTKGSNKKVTYILKSADRTVVLGDSIPEMFKQMVQDSYWNNASTPVIQSVNINNIIALHNRAMG